MRINDKETVAVVVPLYKSWLSDDEKISLRHLYKYLGEYDKYLLIPQKLNAHLDGFESKRFPDHYFRGKHTYNSLLVEKKFYKSFKDYKYILIYQLDCLVFSNQLEKWCQRDYDYIGAPWLKEEGKNTHVDQESVGNGGFSLRKIDSFLKVLDKHNSVLNNIKRLCNSIFNILIALDLRTRIKKLVKAIIKGSSLASVHKKTSKIINKAILKKYIDYRNEDLFWSFEAAKYVPNFKVASVNDALQFAFEVNPKVCFKRNNECLPFGCHAWNKYDRDFWEPYLLV